MSCLIWVSGIGNDRRPAPDDLHARHVHHEGSLREVVAGSIDLPQQGLQLREIAIVGNVDLRVRHFGTVMEDWFGGKFGYHLDPRSGMGRTE